MLLVKRQLYRKLAKIREKREFWRMYTSDESSNGQ